MLDIWSQPALLVDRNVDRLHKYALQKGFEASTEATTHSVITSRSPIRATREQLNDVTLDT